MLVKSQWKTISKYLLRSVGICDTGSPLFRLHGDKGVRQVSYLIVSAFSFQIGFSSAKFTVAKYISIVYKSSDFNGASSCCYRRYLLFGHLLWYFKFSKRASLLISIFYNLPQNIRSTNEAKLSFLWLNLHSLSFKCKTNFESVKPLNFARRCLV